MSVTSIYGPRGMGQAPDVPCTSLQPCEVDTVVTDILQMSEVKLREAKWVPQISHLEKTVVGFGFMWPEIS